MVRQMTKELLTTSGVLTPALVGVFGAVATMIVTSVCLWAWRQLKNQFIAGHEENKKTLAAILNQTQETNGQVREHTRAIGFLRERTAGLESAVFHRPPITEEESG